jgi:hypothetical protein
MKDPASVFLAPRKIKSCRPELALAMAAGGSANISAESAPAMNGQRAFDCIRRPRCPGCPLAVQYLPAKLNNFPTNCENLARRAHR